MHPPLCLSSSLALMYEFLQKRRFAVCRAFLFTFKAFRLDFIFSAVIMYGRVSFSALASVRADSDFKENHQDKDEKFR